LAEEDILMRSTASRAWYKTQNKRVHRRVERRKRRREGRRKEGKEEEDERENWRSWRRVEKARGGRE
jgi:hypothetical protein